VTQKQTQKSWHHVFIELLYIINQDSKAPEFWSKVIQPSCPADGTVLYSGENSWIENGGITNKTKQKNGII